MDVLLELSCFFDDPPDVGSFTSGSSDFSKFSLNIWNFMIHILSKPDLENFEHYFTSKSDDDHYIHCCGQESLRRNGVAIIVSKRVWNAVF